MKYSLGESPPAVRFAAFPLLQKAMGSYITSSSRVKSTEPSMAQCSAKAPTIQIIGSVVSTIIALSTMCSSGAPLCGCTAEGLDL